MMLSGDATRFGSSHHDVCGTGLRRRALARAAAALAATALLAGGCDQMLGPSAIQVEFEPTTEIDGYLAGAQADLAIERLEIHVEKMEVLKRHDTVKADESVANSVARADFPFAVDALDPVGTVSPRVFATPGLYDTLRMKVDSVGGAGLDGRGTALIFEGTLDGVPFLAQTQKLPPLTVADGTGVAIEDGDVVRIAVELPVASWMLGIDLNALPRDASGRVVIDETRNIDAHKTFERNIRIHTTEMRGVATTY